MHRQPDGWLVRRRPCHAVPLMGGDVDVVAGLHLEDAIFELKSSRALQHGDPFVLILIVPKTLGRGMAVGDDPFNSHVRTKNLLTSPFGLFGTGLTW